MQATVASISQRTVCTHQPAIREVHDSDVKSTPLGLQLLVAKSYVCMLSAVPRFNVLLRDAHCIAWGTRCLPVSTTMTPYSPAQHMHTMPGKPRAIQNIKGYASQCCVAMLSAGIGLC